MDELEEQEVDMCAVGVFYELEPVRNGLHLAYLLAVQAVQDAHRHHDHFLLFQVHGCHELQKKFFPEISRLDNGHRKLWLLRFFTVALGYTNLGSRQQ